MVHHITVFLLVLRKKNMHLDSYVCELCILQNEEKLDIYSSNAVKIICLAIGITVPSWLKPDRATRRMKRNFHKPFAMEVIILMCWSIWTTRNGWFFQNKDPKCSRLYFSV
jgi:hypothetical protein